MDITLKEVKSFLEENKEEKETVKFLEGLKGKVNLETVKDAVENVKEVKAWYLSEKDSAVTKGIDGWKEKSLPGEIKTAEEKLRLELSPKETEDQKKVRELMDSHTTLQKQLKKKDLLSVAKDRMIELKLNPARAGFYIGEDEDSTLANINLIGEDYDKGVEARVTEKFKVDGRVVHKDKTKPAITDEAYAAMSPEEQVQNYKKFIEQ